MEHELAEKINTKNTTAWTYFLSNIYTKTTKLLNKKPQSRRDRCEDDIERKKENITDKTENIDAAVKACDRFMTGREEPPKDNTKALSENEATFACARLRRVVGCGGGGYFLDGAST